MALSSGVRRPGLVTVLGFLYIAGGVFSLFAILLTFFDTGADAQTRNTLVFDLGRVAFFIIIGRGFIKGRSWARTIHIVLSVLGFAGLIVGIVFTFSGGFKQLSFARTSGTLLVYVLSIVINVLIIKYLYGPRCRAFFLKESDPGNISSYSIDPWYCYKCDTTNPPDVATCSCGYVRESSSIPASPLSEPRNVTLAEEANIISWVCKNCGSSNDQMAASCGGCGGDK